MTVASAPLTDSMQALIDARLDTIDRMLLGRVHREGVLAVLARLDPPEAYLPDEAVDGPMTSGVASARVAPLARPTRPGAGQGKLTRISGILGMIAFGLVLVAPILLIIAELMGSQGLFYFSFAVLIFLVSVSGIAAATLAIYARLRDSWAVAGLLLGIISTLIAAVGGVLLLVRKL